MPVIKYQHQRLNRSSLVIIDSANEIIEEYEDAGYDLTLRQLYYQFVARDIIPNNDREYKRLGGIISNARLNGLIDWDAIIDRTRYLRKNSHWESPREIIESCAEQFKIDLRETQKDYVEVWIEKDALIGIVDSVCGPLDVPCFSCRGYVSQSAMWRAAKRLLDKEVFHDTHILHLGDHDPSGIDMSRDIKERLHMFGSKVEVHRIALNMDQVKAQSPPPNPAKITDSRCDSYIKRFGTKSWELDALEPSFLDNLITGRINSFTDQEEFENQQFIQDEHRQTIMRIANNMEE
ncbi:MAG: hypothetical protein PVI43_00685 [Candidatus Bathyarchaeota archaeon]|jgi:hypothetical protein